MVDRIPKVDVDRMRVQRKEDAADDQGSGGHPEQQAEEEEKKSSFAPKLDFKKAMRSDDKTAAHQTLWRRPTVPMSEAAAQHGNASRAVNAELAADEEVTHSTTITFLRAVGIIRKSGRLNWATMSLFAFALLGFVSTVVFLLHALF